MKRIGILLPNNRDSFPNYFAMNLTEMVSTFYLWREKNKRQDVELCIFTKGGFMLDVMRNDLVAIGIQSGCSHLLFLDTDMTFPKELITTMIEDLEHNPKMEAVTGIYTWKTPPFVPHLYQTLNKKTGKFHISVKFPLDKFFQVEGAGTGVIMIDSKVFLRTEQPWFKFGAVVEGGEKYGEDLYFCVKAKPKIMCDPRLQCQHFKTEHYGLDTFIESNGLKVTKKGFNITKKQLKEIEKKHLLTKGQDCVKLKTE